MSDLEDRKGEAALAERREFLVLLSGGAALPGVGALAGCGGGSPTSPSATSSSG